MGRRLVQSLSTCTSTIVQLYFYLYLCSPMEGGLLLWVVNIEVLFLWISYITKSCAPHPYWHYILICAATSWSAGRLECIILLLLYNDILFQQLSLGIKFFHVYLLNNLRQKIPSYPKSNTAKITVCCFVQISCIAFITHTHLNWGWKLMFLLVNKSYF